MTAPHAGDPAQELIGRIRASLTAGHLREIRMFGAIAVMVDDVMAVAVQKDGSLLVRVDPNDDARLLEEPGASRADMGTGRSMGTGWIHVEADAIHSELSLNHWLGAATRRLARRQKKPA